MRRGGSGGRRRWTGRSRAGAAVPRKIEEGIDGYLATEAALEARDDHPTPAPDGGVLVVWRAPPSRRPGVPACAHHDHRGASKYGRPWPFEPSQHPSFYKLPRRARRLSSVRRATAFRMVETPGVFFDSVAGMTYAIKEAPARLRAVEPR